MSEISLILVLQFKTSKFFDDMAKVSKNLRKSALLAEYFSFWTDLTVFFPL